VCGLADDPPGGKILIVAGVGQHFTRNRDGKACRNRKLVDDGLVLSPHNHKTRRPGDPLDERLLVFRISPVLAVQEPAHELGGVVKAALVESVGSKRAGGKVGFSAPEPDVQDGRVTKSDEAR